MNSTVLLLKKLFKMDVYLEEFQKPSDLSKELMDTFFEIQNISIDDVYEEIITNSSDFSFLNELNRLIFSIRELIKKKHVALELISSHSFFKTALLPYEDEIKGIQDEAKVAWKKVKELSATLESKSFMSEDVSSLEKQHDEMRQEYKKIQQRLEEAYDRQDQYFKQNNRILRFSFEAVDSFLLNLEKRLLSINSTQEAKEDPINDSLEDPKSNSQDGVPKEDSEMFINTIVSSCAHSLFVRCGFIREVDPSTFYRQISFLEEFSLQKLQRKDKYIAYAIAQLSQYVKSAKSKEWELTMAKNFEINHYDKVSKVKESKNDMHKKIDKILDRLKEKDSL